MDLTVHAEDIMTPRRFLKQAADETTAKMAADRGGFDAVPILRRDGLVTQFWSRAAGAKIRISRQHKTRHDSMIEQLLPMLGAHIVQFVYYRSELVGLIDASDLNKPIARLVWLQPMLELERAVLDAVQYHAIDDERQAAALGHEAGSARARQAKAKRHDLEMPLLGYAQFPFLLRAAVRLGIIQLSEQDLTELNEVRKRAAHGALHSVIDDRSDCTRMIRTLQTARGAIRSATRRQVSF